MSDHEELPRSSAALKGPAETEGLRFGHGIITGRVLTVLIVSIVGSAIAVALVLMSR